MSFADFLRQAWIDHNDDAAAVGERLRAAAALMEAPADVPGLARILTHVYGEHLARWDDGVALLEKLKSGPQASDEGLRAVERGIATLQFAAGNGIALDRFPVSERIAILGTAASALVAQRRHAQGIRAYESALALGARGLPPGDPAIRALAVGGNNLAVALEEKPGRDAVETRAMVNAAKAGLEYWKLAGTWLEEERAEYRLAKSLFAAGDRDAALEHARRCLALCEANDVPPDDRTWCNALLEELGKADVHG